MKRGKYKENPLVEKYKGIRISNACIGYIGLDGEIVYNEMINHPKIRRIMRRNGFKDGKWRD